MRAVLEILDGPFAERVLEINPGQTLTIGRTAKSQLMLPHDNFLSGLHFSVECRADGCILRDHNSSNGTWVNGARVNESPLQDGDLISAGQTRFRCRVERQALLPEDRTSTIMLPAPRLEDLHTAVLPPTLAAIDAGALTPPQQAFAAYLKLLPAPLFAVANSTVEDRIPNWLIGSGEVYQYLADGMSIGDVLPPGAYLAYLPATSPLLSKLVKESWGRNWCIFFTSMQAFADIRKHFRQMLLLHCEDGRRFYFRYFDPRVLDAFLSTCTLPELTQFFGPVQLILAQDGHDQTKLIEYSIGPAGLNCRRIPLP